MLPRNIFYIGSQADDKPTSTDILMKYSRGVATECKLCHTEENWSILDFGKLITRAYLL